MRTAVVLLLSLACVTARAQPTDPAPAPRLPRVGLALDAGLPGGAGLMLQVRALSFLRVGAGPMFSGIGYGAKGGLQLSPAWRFAPALEAEAGVAPRADLSRLAGHGSFAKDLEPALAHASYWFASGLLGFDAGSPRGLSFLLRVGLSHLVVETHRSATTAGSGEVDTITLSKTKVTANVPCAKLGLQYWF